VDLSSIEFNNPTTENEFLVNIAKGNSDLEILWRTTSKEVGKGNAEKKEFKYVPANYVTNRYWDEFKTRRDSITKKDLINKYGSKTAVLEKVWNMKTEYLTDLDIDNVVQDILDEVNSGPELYYTNTPGLFEVNPSLEILSKKFVENLSKVDLMILRNCIYAKHGYSFKQSRLTSYFLGESWYMPISNDIRSELTNIEKSNIKLLLAYERHAKEYFDEFGR
jgi:hypothetical protein